MPQVLCKICQKEFYVKPSHQKLGYGKYCSRICSSNSQRKGRFVDCSTCGKKVWRMPALIARSQSGHLFCSKSCSLSWKNSELRSGVNHPLWNGGESVYRKLLERSSRVKVCERCGLKDTRVLAVHHIDHNRQNNTLDNLRWLCMNCHFLTHQDDKQKHMETMV